MTTTEFPPPPPASADWRAPEPQVVYVKSGGNGMAVAGFVLALLGAITGMIPLFFFGAFFFGILGMVFSGIGFKKSRRPEVQRAGRKMAIAGLILSVVAFGLGIAGVAITDKAVNDLDKAFDKASQQWDSYADCTKNASFENLSQCESYLED
jgi:hypothetical protein